MTFEYKTIESPIENTLLKEKGSKFIGFAYPVTNEKELKSIGFDMPFMANLSLKLKYYGLVDDVITNMNAMVKQLWP